MWRPTVVAPAVQANRPGRPAPYRSERSVPEAAAVHFMVGQRRHYIAWTICTQLKRRTRTDERFRLNRLDDAVLRGWFVSFDYPVLHGAHGRSLRFDRKACQIGRRGDTCASLGGSRQLVRGGARRALLVGQGLPRGLAGVAVHGGAEVGVAKPGLPGCGRGTRVAAECSAQYLC
jgi:hypothetical protein